MVRALCARPAARPSPAPRLLRIAAPPPQPARPNVLWVMMDDLRALLPPQRLAGGGGGLTSATPNIDRLARDGVDFPKAYCQVSVCAPSRSSFASGRRPDSMRVWQWESDFRKALGAAAVVSLPQHFKNHGYLVVGAGKTYEPDYPARYDQPHSWSERPPLRGGRRAAARRPRGSLASALTLGLRPRWRTSSSRAPTYGADRAFFEHACASFAIDAMTARATGRASPARSSSPPATSRTCRGACRSASARARRATRAAPRRSRPPRRARRPRACPTSRGAPRVPGA